MNAPLPTVGISNASGSDRFSTHVVKNQAALPTGFNAFDDDVVLKAAIEREAPWAASRCSAVGKLAGEDEIQELARQANRNIPELKTHDRFGNRIDWVEFHPAWHQLMSLAWRHEVPNLSWTAKEKQPHYARGAVLSLESDRAGNGVPDGDGLRVLCRLPPRTRARDLGAEIARDSL